MINSIVHAADIHIRKSPSRNDEYEKVFNELKKSLELNKPDRIVIVGDLVNDYLDLQGEQLILASNFLNMLASIAPVRITRGNHDFSKANKKRTDSVEAIVKSINNPNIIYYNKTGFYVDENVTWAVFHHGDGSTPWTKNYSKDNNQTYIDLYHNPIRGCKTASGFEMNSNSYFGVNDFKSDYLFAGDIHLQQYLDKNKTKGYCGSLISQDFSEGDKFHGYLSWDIKNTTVNEISIYNQYSFKDVYISQFTDFDDLDIEIDDPTEYIKLRLVWNTLPSVKNKDNERKITTYLKSKYNIISVTNKKNFIEEDKIEVSKSVNLLNINDNSIQHSIFNEYLTKIGVDKNTINELIKLDINEVTPRINIEEHTNCEWNIIKFGAENYRSYGRFDIDWRDQDGLFQIVGKNQIGKTSMLASLAYLLYNNTLETESSMKFGDSRYVNNRNGATFCSAYGVIESGGVYYGLKRRTEIVYDKNGGISKTPTTLNYYLLSSPDDDMNDSNSLNKLDEETKNKTQKNIDTIIGTYDNFMRVVMTTSDTLNKILSNNMAEFIDSLLFDSGLDIFDKKLNALKEYKKKLNEKSRITCNVELTNNNINNFKFELEEINKTISTIENIKIPENNTSINKGKDYLETLTKKLYKIDDEIYSLDINDVNEKIKTHNDNITELNNKKDRLEKSISELIETYNEKELEKLLLKKENHKTFEYNEKLKIKASEQNIRDEEHLIELINGEIYNLKKDGGKLKQDIIILQEDIIKIQESKDCPFCHRLMEEEHQQHINDKVKEIENKIKELETSMFDIAGKITNKESIDILVHRNNIIKENAIITDFNTNITKETALMISVLKSIGELQNQKNDVDKRKLLVNECNQIPLQINNENLNIKIYQQKIDSYNNSLLQIEENKKTELIIAKAKTRIKELEDELYINQQDVVTNKIKVNDIQNNIKIKSDLIIAFTEQEKQDEIIKLYESCVHRNGIPKQMLSNYIIPRINNILENMLSVSPFNVWLDETDLKPKLVFNDRPNAVIDCISSSGKERTFSSIVIKYALNQINVKSKPTIFLLDEVMGKLDDDSVEEFKEILQLIKNSMKKVLIIEHKSEISPDYVITVSQDSDGISSLSIS